ncbi:MAG: T9SS type A sorting domain-containing protein [Bacteroidales bacterium]|nr:T9SS type A sorting domain-containing protein [Bacteroidales bacterium]
MKNLLVFISLIHLLSYANAQVDSMILIGNIYVDKYEAPNIEGETPFVMFNYTEAECWCQARGKRLLFDDEWEMVAGGPSSLSYVYGNTYDSLACNDNKLWIAPNQTLLNQWPFIPYLSSINSFSELIDSVINNSTSAAQSANEVMRLYQADTAGSNTGCLSYYGVSDMNGNVIEWTTRKDGGNPGFHGNQKGGYWAWPSTIQTDILSHGDGFRYFYLGFRCAMDSSNGTTNTFKNNDSFSIYPNPAKDKIIIKTQQTSTQSYLTILNVNGQKLIEKQIKDTKTQLDISKLKSGIYFLKLMSNKTVEVRKIIKE